MQVTDGSAGPLVGDAFPGAPHAGMLEGETAALLVAGTFPFRAAEFKALPGQFCMWLNDRHH